MNYATPNYPRAVAIGLALFCVLMLVRIGGVGA